MGRRHAALAAAGALRVALRVPSSSAGLQLVLARAVLLELVLMLV